MRPPLTHAGRAAARQYAAPLALACTVGPGRPRGPRQAPYLVCHRQTGGHASGQRRVSAPTPYAAPAARMAATSANYRDPVPSGCGAAEAGVRRGGQRRPRVRGCRRSAPRSSPRWAPGRNARRGAQTLRGVRRWPPPCGGVLFAPLRPSGPPWRAGRWALGARRPVLGPPGPRRAHSRAAVLGRAGAALVGGSGAPRAGRRWRPPCAPPLLGGRGFPLRAAAVLGAVPPPIFRPGPPCAAQAPCFGAQSRAEMWTEGDKLDSPHRARIDRPGAATAPKQPSPVGYQLRY